MAERNYGGYPPAADPSEVSDTMPVWRSRIQKAQRSRQLPEVIAAIEARSEARKRVMKRAKKAKRLNTVQAYSKSVFGGSMFKTRQREQRRGFGFGGAGGAPGAAAPACAMTSVEAVSAFGGDEGSDGEGDAVRDELAGVAMLSLQRAASCSDDDEADAAIEQARQQLESAGHAWAARGMEGAEDAVAALSGGGAEGAPDLLSDLLSDLKNEPTDDADAARRFKLFETHSETVATVRKGLFSFWEEAQADVPVGPPRTAIEASLQAVDNEGNMQVNMEGRYWFVYSMAVKVTENERAIEATLRALQTKLELLAAVDDCPVCLESIEESDERVALGCAHKLHKDCWRHWSAHCVQQHKTPFCPLCRNEEFLEDMLQD